LVGTALDGTLPPTGGQSDLQPTVPVGGTDGIAPIQLLSVSYKVEHMLPVNWRVADINWPNRIVKRSTYRELLRDFLHLVGHDPIPGSIFRSTFRILFGYLVKLSTKPMMFRLDQQCNYWTIFSDGQNSLPLCGKF
jgi:hypothetical protein